MQVKQLTPSPQRSFAIVMDPGEEAVSALLSFARDHDVTAASFTGLGAFSSVVLGYFDYGKKEYERLPLDEQVEVASLVGNFATDESGQPKLHPHIVVGRRNGQACAGHLLEGRVRPTLEIVVEDTPAHLHRKPDPDTGLPLLQL